LQSCSSGEFGFIVRTIASHTQAITRGGHAVSVAEDRRARHQHGGAGSNDQRRRRRVDASVDFHLAPGLAPLDQFARTRSIFGSVTKCPSITSTWIRSAPFCSTTATC